MITQDPVIYKNHHQKNNKKLKKKILKTQIIEQKKGHFT